MPEKEDLKKVVARLGAVAHTCNPKHFKGRDEEDQI
jgi:hypothetical protein